MTDRSARRYLLIHGGWQGGWCWDEVVTALISAGHEVFAPTLRGLESGEVDRAGIQLSDMVEELAGEIERDGLDELTLVGHSGGGPVIQLLCERIPDRVAGIVFVDAWVLLDGESVYDVLPDEVGAGLHAAAQATRDQTIEMPPDFWVHGLMNDVEAAEAERWLPRLVPTPDGWMSQPARLPTFADLRVPTGYVRLAEDASVPPAVFDQCIERLTDKQVRVTTAPGAHEAMLTRPRELAQAILEVSSPS